MESARAKLDRAHQHLHQLGKKIRADGENDAYGISYYRDTNAKVIWAEANYPRELFIGYSISAGEVVHQARSALEHAVWELVPDPVEGQTGLPVIHIEGDYERFRATRIPGINPGADAIIRGLQPFGPDYKTDSLWILDEFWKRDKHRLLNTCADNPLGVTVYYEFPLTTTSPHHFESVTFNFPDEIEDGTEVFRTADPGPEVKVHMEMVYLSVVFKDGPAAEKPVTEFLLDLVQLSESVVNVLAGTII